MNTLEKLRAGEEPKEGTYNNDAAKLYEPFETPDAKNSYAVYAENGNGDVVLVRFDAGNAETGLRCDMQRDRSTSAYWTCKTMETATTDHAFFQVAVVDMASKTLTSVRDGVQEYMGVELGIKPHDKVFRVYRSPETISNIIGAMDGLPIIEGHIDPDEEPSNGQTIGTIKSSEVVPCIDETFGSTQMIRNAVAVSTEALSVVDSGRRELSLGYKAKMRKHDEYDFEQYDIVPKHLAIVDQARGGSVLNFEDRGQKSMKDKLKKFMDAEGAFTAKRLAELLQGLIDNVGEIEGSEFKKIIPILEKAGAVMGGADPTEKPAEEGAPAEEGSSEDMQDGEDKPMEDEGGEEEKPVTDSKTYTDADFKDAVAKKAKEHIEIVAKAKDFLDEDYNFADKSAADIMRDAVKTEHDESFTDEQLPIAFKLLKKQSIVKFEDSEKEDSWTKEL